jgi:hypothetical protein
LTLCVRSSFPSEWDFFMRGVWRCQNLSSEAISASSVLLLGGCRQIAILKVRFAQ